jgi:hypothetical protein
VKLIAIEIEGVQFKIVCSTLLEAHLSTLLWRGSAPIRGLWFRFFFEFIFSHCTFIAHIFSIFTIPWTRQASAALKQETEPQSNAHSAVISHNIRGSMNYVKRIEKRLHKYFRVMKQTCHSATHPRTFSRILQSLSYSEVSRVKGFYPIPQHRET